MPIWIPDFSVILFWACAISLFYSFLGYPLLIGLLAKLISRRSAASEFESPPVPVSVILVVHNGKTLIGPRLENLLNQDHPIKEIIVICDGCTDGTPEAVQAVANPKVRTILQPRRSGKSSGLNLGIHNATSEIVVFADLRQRFRPDTISRLLENFANPEVGAVSGSLEIKASLDTTGRGVGSYWNLEKKLRHAESCFDSCIGCTGAIYASRLSLLEPIPEDTILDDVVIPMQIALAGYRVLFEPRAIAFDPQPQDPGLESIRKQRTLAGNFQMLFRYPKWLLPWKNRLWLQLLSHKYLRLTLPFSLATMLAANFLLLDRSFYKITFALQVGFYTLAAMARFTILKHFRIASLPAGLLFLNTMVVRGLLSYLFDKKEGVWENSQASSVIESGK